MNISDCKLNVSDQNKAHFQQLLRTIMGVSDIANCFDPISPSTGL